MDMDSEHEEFLPIDVHGAADWDRAISQSWTLTKRAIGYDPHDLEQIEADSRTLSAAQMQQAAAERRQQWIPASQLLALAVWRAALDAQNRVDDVPLDRPLQWLGGARHAELYEQPLPPWKKGLPGSWDRLRVREDALLEPARWVLNWHVRQDLKENGALHVGERPPPQLRLGDRCRAVRSGPYQDHHKPRWADIVEHALEAVAEATARLGRRWLPGPDARHAATILHTSLIAEPDTPLRPADAAGKLWIQRVVHLDHLHATLAAVQEHHRDAPDLEVVYPPIRPFGGALVSVTLALRQILDTAAELDAIWARRDDTSVSQWDRAHVPLAVRQHIAALEALVAQLADLCQSITTAPDEPE